MDILSSLMHWTDGEIYPSFFSYHDKRDFMIVTSNNGKAVWLLKGKSEATPASLQVSEGAPLALHLPAAG